MANQPEAGSEPPRRAVPRVGAHDRRPLQLLRRGLRRLGRIRRRALFREHQRELRRLKGVHAGDRCFIIGNGPSLNQMDLRPLADEITFGVNAIFLNRDRMGFAPTYYAVFDPNVAEDRAGEINRLTGSTEFFPQDLVYCLTPRTNVLYLPFHYTASEAHPRFSTDVSEVVYLDATVSHLCLQIAYHMGFDDVYLIGMDLTYHVPDYARGVNITSREDDVNHFHPDYFGKGRRWSYPRPDRMAESFQLARDAFEADGRTVFNATAGGKLEVFERRNYDDVICRTQ